jgi:hypothetical protein
MNLDQAIEQMKATITAISSDAVIKTVKMSDEEARLSVYAPAGDLAAIKDACFQPAMDLLTQHGLDVQVFPYDIATTPPPE